MLLTIRAAILAFARWIDYLLAAPEHTPVCEYRRPARITCHRHGERERRFHAVEPADTATRTVVAQSWWS